MSDGSSLADRLAAAEQEVGRLQSRLTDLEQGLAGLRRTAGGIWWRGFLLGAFVAGSASLMGSWWGH